MVDTKEPQRAVRTADEKARAMAGHWGVQWVDEKVDWMACCLAFLLAALWAER